MKTILLAFLANTILLSVTAQNNFTPSFGLNTTDGFSAQTHGPAAAGYEQPDRVFSIRIRDFAVQQYNADVSVSFIVDNEMDLTGYDIERSVDGIFFTAVTTITPVNSGHSERYQFTDKKACYRSEKLFYRIKISATSNRSDFTEFLVVYVEGSYTAEITPSVVSRGTPLVLTIKDNDNSMEPRKLDCTDMNGHIIFSQTARPGTQVSINSSNLHKGIYLVQVANTQGGRTRLRFVVQ